MNYEAFLEAKTHVGAEHGFDPIWMPDSLFPFQVAMVELACRKGRAAKPELDQKSLFETL